MKTLAINSRPWTNVVEWPNDENWHHWSTDLNDGRELAIFGTAIESGGDSGVGMDRGEYQGKIHIGKTSVAHGYMDSETLAGAMLEFQNKIIRESQ